MKFFSPHWYEDDEKLWEEKTKEVGEAFVRNGNVYRTFLWENKLVCAFYEEVTKLYAQKNDNLPHSSEYLPRFRDVTFLDMDIDPEELLG